MISLSGRLLLLLLIGSLLHSSTGYLTLLLKYSTCFRGGINKIDPDIADRLSEDMKVCTFPEKLKKAIDCMAPEVVRTIQRNMNLLEYTRLANVDPEEVKEKFQKCKKDPSVVKPPGCPQYGPAFLDCMELGKYWGKVKSHPSVSSAVNNMRKSKG